jgi:hypothetical protein
MSTLIETITESEIQASNQPTSLAQVEFRSDWIYDSNGSNHRVLFRHGLNRTPRLVTVLFSDSDNQATVYPVLWSWDPRYSGNPVTVGMDALQVFLEITQDNPLHGVWNPNDGWKTFNDGYWMVIASV